jgi:hypothetical protein
MKIKYTGINNIKIIDGEVSVSVVPGQIISEDDGVSAFCLRHLSQCHDYVSVGENEIETKADEPVTAGQMFDFDTGADVPTTVQELVQSIEPVEQAIAKPTVAEHATANAVKRGRKPKVK